MSRAHGERIVSASVTQHQVIWHWYNIGPAPEEPEGQNGQRRLAKTCSRHGLIIAEPPGPRSKELGRTRAVAPSTFRSVDAAFSCSPPEDEDPDRNYFSRPREVFHDGTAAYGISGSSSCRSSWSAGADGR